MKILSYTLATVGVVATAALFALTYNTPKSSNFLQLQGIEEDFAKYVAKYGKNYDTQEEYEARMKQYAANLEEARSYIDETATFTVGENKFADWTPEEYKVLLGYKRITAPRKFRRLELEVQDIPDTVNWVTAGAVTPVKDQGQCGSCWSFSTTGTLEGAHFIKTGELVSLSEQQFVDCARIPQWSNLGCSGGNMLDAQDYAKVNPIVLESDYPYTAQNGKCTYDASKGVVQVTDDYSIAQDSVSALKTAIAKAPVSIGIEADKAAFQLYTGGVLNSVRCGTNLDHGVLAVGYGHDDASGLDYYLVKNSWGPDWGEAGYVKIAQVDGDGICGIQLEATQSDTN